MKVVKNVVLALLIVTAGVACKKDKTEKTVSIDGIWTGKMGQNSDLPTGQFEINIKSNGVIQRINGSGNVVAAGLWQLEGNKFEATYYYSGNTTVVDIDATFDKSQSKLTGNWSNNGGEHGTWTVSK